MTLEECCRQAEVRLYQAQDLLDQPDPDRISRCESELFDIAVSLQTVLTQRPAKIPGDSQKESLQRVRAAARRLGFQIEQASNLCMGWAQLGFSAGYTRQGRPDLIPREARAAFEA